ncbi:hypothetical protein B0H16DRAFT_1456960 [Mycena metata]|uniref:Uncharacterized protein n=1 Tax=Mycena metata TaxID=1033252 RepID=A0AAD7J9I5_9AGAR|nr:hypothetical protein B0H16DRAFT_1456960 [Mycena metata]
MPGIPDVSLPNLIAPLSLATSTKVTLCIMGLVLIIASLSYASPTRLTRILSNAMSSLEKVYTDLVCMQLMGLLTADDVARLHMLQLEVGAFRAQTLLHSLSWRATIYDFLKGRSFKLYRCINAVRDLETRIRILEEEYRAHPRAFGPSWPSRNIILLPLAFGTVFSANLSKFG